jgi:hypothetical protein
MNARKRRWASGGAWGASGTTNRLYSKYSIASYVCQGGGKKWRCAAPAAPRHFVALALCCLVPLSRIMSPMSETARFQPEYAGTLFVFWSGRLVSIPRETAPDAGGRVRESKTRLTEPCHAAFRAARNASDRGWRYPDRVIPLQTGFYATGGSAMIYANGGDMDCTISRKG